MNSEERKRMSQMNGYSPIYCIFYYTEEGKIKIFAGGKFFPLSNSEVKDRGFIIPIDGVEQPREDVIKKYNGLM